MTFPGSSGIVAQDILLEATVFVAVGKSGILHDDLWPLLVTEDGRLLARLLERLQHSATTSNALLVGAALAQVPDLELHLATAFRLPSWPYWPGILTLLSKHREEIPAELVHLQPGSRTSGYGRLAWDGLSVKRRRLSR